MASDIDTMSVLVETDQSVHDVAHGFAVRQIIRSYASARRAEQDLDLLQQSSPSRTFEVRPLDHIDD